MAKSERLDQIEAILDDLRGLLVAKDTPEDKKYAIEENIAFFEAAKSPWKYVKWLIARARKIDGARLLELTDFPFERWDIEMHKALSSLQKKRFPGLIDPLVDRITKAVNESRSGTLFILDAGAGAMETEAQVIRRLGRNSGKVFLVGADKSAAALGVARRNLEEAREKANIYEFEELDETELKRLAERESGSCAVVLCKNDIFALDRKFSANFFDLAFSSLFIHHLAESERNRLDAVEKKISKKVAEYDGRKKWGSVIPQSIMAWGNPVFLNASIFSILRYPTEQEIRRRSPNVSFFWTGTYLLELK